MPAQPTDIEFPFGGLIQSAPDEVIPQGMTPGPLRNMRPRDWRANGKRRGSMRPGLRKLIDQQPAGDTLVQAGESMSVVENIGGTVLGEVLWTDTFDRSDTAAGVLGDFTGDASNDYVVSGTKIAVSTTAYAPAGIIAAGSWNAAHAAGNAARVYNADLACEDRRNDYPTSSGSPTQLSVCYFKPTSGGTLPTDNFAIRVTFQLGTTAASTEGLIGLFCCGKVSDIAGGSYDDAFACGIGMSAAASAGPIYIPNQWFNQTGVWDDNLLSTTVGRGPSWFSYSENVQAARGFVAGATKTIELRKCGNRVDLYVDGEPWYVWPDITQRSDGGGATTVDIASTDFGFLFYNVGDQAANAIRLIDKIEVLRCTTTTPMTDEKIIAVAGGNVYVGTEDDGLAEANSGGSVYADQADVMIVPGLGPSASGGVQYAYLLDGHAYRKVSMSNPTVSTWTPSPGSHPAGVTDTSQKARYGVRWRNRIMLYGLLTNPDNWYGSRADDADDWDQTPTDPDGKEAISGDTTDAGLLWAPITCMMPATTDRLLIGLAGELAMMVGDPALGGSIEVVTDTVGIVGPRAACKDDRGNVYFVSFTGMHIISIETGRIQELSHGRMDKFFRSIDHSTHRVLLKWSQGQQGVHIFVYPPAEGAVEHLFWDRDNNHFENDTFPDAMNPTCAFAYRAIDGTDRLVVGGWDGYLRTFSPTAIDDDGEAIDAALAYPPILAGSFDRALLTCVEAKLADSDDRALVEFKAAKAALDLSSAPVKFSHRINGSKPHRIYESIGDAAVSVALRSVEGSRFSIERVRMHIESGGPVYPGVRG